MRKAFAIATAITLLLLTLNSCTKDKCNDSNSPNYGGYGSCTDLTTGVVGTYTGTFGDSIVGVDYSSYPSQTVSVTKIDNSHIQFTPSDNSFYPFSAKIESISGTDNYSLTISSGSYSNNTFTGTYIGNANIHGSFNSSNKVISSAIMITDNNNGTSTIEVFGGVKQ
ncbi:MAG: hypothetical protein JST83_18420 [Bacteroidetes bacterium]|nr:hypothetical protein [Bacteroidota bacterium]